MTEETAKFSWRRTAFIAVAFVALGLAAHAALMLRIQGPATLPSTAKVTAPRPPPAASISFLPAEVQKALTSLCSPCIFADSNAPWNATDVMGDGLPQRRLVTTEKQGSTWLVQYQHGGLATHSHTVVFSLSPTVHIAQGSSCIPSHRACKW